MQAGALPAPPPQHVASLVRRPVRRQAGKLLDLSQGPTGELVLCTHCLHMHLKLWMCPHADAKPRSVTLRGVTPHYSASPRRICPCPRPSLHLLRSPHKPNPRHPLCVHSPCLLKQSSSNHG